MLDMSDFTFCIPVKIDSPERQENLTLNLNYMLRHIHTNILIGEEDDTPKVHIPSNLTNRVSLSFFKKEQPFFYRTKLLNTLFVKATTPYVVNYDLDVFINIEAWSMTAKLLRQKFYSFVYPYNGIFYACPRKYSRAIIHACETRAHLFHKDFTYSPFHSYGGAVAARRTSYLEMGGENENFKSWGAEDWERFCRWQALQYKWTRVSAPESVLYHLNHPVLTDSSKANPFFKSNEKEYEKVKNMSTEQLKTYVKSWKWAQAFQVS